MVYGEVRSDAVAELQDVNRRELFLLGVLAVVILYFGIHPAPLVDVMTPSLDALFSIVMATL